MQAVRALQWTGPDSTSEMLEMCEHESAPCGLPRFKCVAFLSLTLFLVSCQHRFSMSFFKIVFGWNYLSNQQRAALSFLYCIASCSTGYIIRENDAKSIEKYLGPNLFCCLWHFDGSFSERRKTKGLVQTDHVHKLILLVMTSEKTIETRANLGRCKGIKQLWWSQHLGNEG